MKFYNRIQELTVLNKLYQQTNQQGTMVVLTGRRRVGKTALALKFAEDKTFIYLFIAKKSEPLLAIELLEEIKKHIDVPIIGEVKNFKTIIQLLIEAARNKPLVVIIDEFQEFYNINPAVYSDIQHIWDINKNHTKLNLLFIGSVYSLMHKIFQNAKEPLFGRANQILTIKPFSIKEIAHILRDQQIFSEELLFQYFVFTGGLPKYLEIFLNNQLNSLNTILDFILSEHSPFIDEGKTVLIEEFGREYTVYFSVLELIALGKTSRSEIESILNKNVGGHIERLETDYTLIAKYKPIHAKLNSRLVKYKIIDPFLNWWFRFLYSNWTAVETRNFAYIKQIFRRDYSSYCGRMLERFFAELIAESKQYNHIGCYWEKGNTNEIDIVAVNDLEKKLLLVEVKLNYKKISLPILKQKSRNLLALYQAYKPEWIALSLEQTQQFL